MMQTGDVEQRQDVSIVCYVLHGTQHCAVCYVQLAAQQRLCNEWTLKVMDGFGAIADELKGGHTLCPGLYRLFRR